MTVDPARQCAKDIKVWRGPGTYVTESRPFLLGPCSGGHQMERVGCRYVMRL